jgi:micrococcal nuclease
MKLLLISFIAITGIILSGCSKKTAEQIKQECYDNAYTYGGFSNKMTADSIYIVCLERHGLKTGENTQEPVQVQESPKVIGEGTEIENPQKYQQETTDAEGVKVTRVIDGDTIEIEGGVRVRYIGIDTPETVNSSSTIQCYGKEASNKNRELVEGKQVSLDKDVSETDRYGRLLRYVYVGDTFVNDFLVRQGFASASSYPPDVKFQSQFTEAQTEARNNNRGLWAACSGSGPTRPNATTQPTTPQSGNCDQSYPTVCIPPAPPDLDCGDISYRRFKVISPDSHNFDGDHDGVGCESL